MGITALMLAAAAITGSGSTTTVTFAAQVHGPEPPAWTLRLRRADGAPGQDQMLPGRGRWEVRLPSRSIWEATLEASGHWAAPKAFAAGDAAELVLDAWPVGELAVPLRGTVVPPRATAVFRSPPGAAPALTGEQPCRIEEGWIRCSLPATALDVFLKFPGFATEAYWNVAIGPGATTRLVGRTLRPGASVSGFVQVPGGEPGAVEVTLLAVDAAPAATPGGSKPRVRANSRGYFQFAGVSPGLYRIAAEAKPDRAGSTGTFTVREQAETELTQPVLVEPLARLSVQVIPAAPPNGSPWKIRLFASSGLGEPREADVGPDGLAEFSRLQPGDYALLVGEAQRPQAVWGQRQVTVPEEPQVVITLDLVEVEGEVTYDSRPLAAGIAFGGTHGVQRVPLTSNEEGRFRGFLPRAGAWDVLVMGLRQKVSWAGQVEVPQPVGGEPAHVSLRVAGREVRGIVVNEDGTPQSQAHVVLQPVAGSYFYHPGDVTDADGRFRLTGLPEGAFAVRAEYRDRTSEPTVIRLKGTEEAPELRLVLGEGFTLRGRVLGVRGPQAGVPVEMNGLVALTLPPLGTTDESGEFTLQVGKGAGIVSVVAFPTFGALAVRCTAQPVQGAFDVPVPSLQGSLELTGLPTGPPLPPLVAIHQGCPVFLHTLFRWARHTGARPLQREGWLIPALPPGRWDVCRWLWTGESPGPGPCAGGVLPPGGLLNLDVSRLTKGSS